MHYLHKILVYIPDVSKEADSMIRDSLVSAIRSHAESETEGFYKEVFDWRETDTAGRWSDAYPENVLLGSDDPNSLYEAVAECYQTQKSEIDHLIAWTAIIGILPTGVRNGIYTTTKSPLATSAGWKGAHPLRQSLIQHGRRLSAGLQRHQSYFPSSPSNSTLKSRVTILPETY